MFEFFPSKPLGLGAAARPVVLSDRGAFFEQIAPPSRVIREFSGLPVQAC
jgi:hypothetical protein